MTREDGSSISRMGDVVIVRRRYEEDEGHHGGVWKIAFADFMTAMMAFFLVMWLVNASEDATKKQIAQYFNPIKLNASTPPSTGLETSERKPAAPEPEPAAEPPSSAVELPGSPDGKPVGGTETGGEDQALFRDPYAVLAEIVAEGGAGVTNGRSEPVANGTGLPGLNGGDAYRDPFDPSAWQAEPNMVQAPETELPIDDPAGTVAVASLGTPAPAAFATEIVEIAPEAPLSSEASEATASPVTAVDDAPSAEEAAAGSASEAEESRAEAIEAELLSGVGALAPGAAAGLDVSVGEDGIVISLADSLTSGMFEIGSARPSAETVRVVEEVARVLSERQGTVVIRGHTDSRPYRGGDYDNWRLSTARAHMAYYMLLRGGLDETRVTAIEGFADRRPKITEDPEAAANRRIEILLIETPA